MTDKAPLVITAGQIQQLQAGDGLAIKDAEIVDLNRNFTEYSEDTKVATGVPKDERIKFRIEVSYTLVKEISVSLVFNGAYTSFSYYINGKKFTVTDLTPYTAVTATPDEGLWFVYFNKLNVFLVSQAPWTIIDSEVELFYFRFDNTNKVIMNIGEERHTAGRDIFNHARNHSQGAIFSEGFAFSQYNGLTNALLASNTDNNFGRAMALFSGGSCFDEDLLYTIAHQDDAIGATVAAPSTDWNGTVKQFLGLTVLAAATTNATTLVFATPHTFITGQGFVVMAGNTTTVRGTGTITTGGTGTSFPTSSVAGRAAGDAIVFSGRMPIYYLDSVAPYIWRNFPGASFLGVSASAAITPASIAAAVAQYNNPATGGFSNLTSTRYFCVFIIATNTTHEPLIAVLGQGQSSNATLATALQEAPFQFTNLVGLDKLNIQETVPVYRITFQYSSQNGFNASRIRLVNQTFINIRISSVSSVVNNPTVTTLPAAQITTDITNFNKNLTAADTTVQAALETLDDKAFLVAANNLSDVSAVQTAINNLTAVLAATNERVLTKDTATGNAIWKLAGAGSKNYLMNGEMRLYQRGALAIVHGGVVSGYALDRYKVSTLNIDEAHIAVTQSTDVPANQGFLNSMKIDVTTQETALAADEFLIVQQTIEGTFFAPLLGKTVTRSIWVKSSLIGKYCMHFSNNAADRVFVKEIEILIANTWEKKTIIFDITNTGTWLFTTGVGMRVGITLAAGSNYNSATDNVWGTVNLLSTVNQVNLMSSTHNFYFTGDMLNEGSEAQSFIPFGGNPASDEQASYNYCEIGSGGAIATPAMFFRTPITSATLYWSHLLRYKKRIAVAPVIYAGTSGTINTIRDVSAAADVAVVIGGYTTTSFYIYWSSTAGSAVAYNWIYDADF